MQLPQSIHRSTGAAIETLAYLGLCGTALMWASAFIAGKVVLAEMAPLSTGALRYLIAGLALAPFAWRARPTAPALRSVARPLLVMIVAAGVLYPWLFLGALARTEAANCSLLIALNPLFTVLLSPLVGERRQRRWGGVVLALAGAGLVITRGRTADIAQLARLEFAVGDLMALTAAALWATFNLASRRVVSVLASSTINFLVYTLGGLCLLLISLPEQPLQHLFHLSGAALVGLLVMAVVSSVLAGQLFLFGVRTVGVNRTVVFIYLVPVLTALLSVVLLGERVGAAQVVGGAAVLAGVYWATRPERSGLPEP